MKKSCEMVSVVMPLFNGSLYLHDAIESVLNQTWINFEFIIINDGSTEDVESIINRFNDPRIKLISRENRGLGETLNELVSLAKGDIVIRMDADDICKPERIEKQVEFLKINRKVVLVGTGICFLIERNVVAAFNPTLGHLAIMQKLLNVRFSLCHPSIAFRRDAFYKAGGYRIRSAGEDLDFFIRMGEVGLLENIDEILLHYRLSRNSIAFKKSSEMTKGYSYALYSARLRASSGIDLSPSEYEAIWKNRSWMDRIYWYSYITSEHHYRKYIISRAQASQTKMLFHLAFASFMRPRVTISRGFELIIKKIR